MNVKKRLVSVLLACTLVAAALTGCGNSEVQAKESTTTENVATEKNTATESVAEAVAEEAKKQAAVPKYIFLRR